MVQFFGVISILMALSANAQSWDLGYTTASAPEVEEIPDSIDGDKKADIVEMTDESNADVIADQEKPPVSSSAGSNSITKISTRKNTFGVETIEKTGPKLYISPVAGLTSIMGNGTVDVAPQYSYGGRLGLLMSENLMLEGGYTYALINTSVPINLVAGTMPNDVFALKQNTIDAGAKFFFLGRESRFRPFVGGALAYASSTYNLTQGYSILYGLTDDFKMKQWQGQGQLGAEIAITKSIVATAAFKLNGILSSSTQSIPNEKTATGLEANKVQAGNSLSHSASYTGSVGVGVYF